MKLKELWVESLPPVHIGRPDIDWDEVADTHEDRMVCGEIADCTSEVPALTPLLELVEEDALQLYGEGASLVHHVRIHSGVFASSALGTLKGALKHEAFGRDLPEHFVNRQGAFHIDVGGDEGTSYFVSSRESTRFALGKFVTCGYSHTALGVLATPVLLALQHQSALIFQPDSGEVVRAEPTVVHGSPRRVGSPGTKHVFIADFVRPEQL